MQKQSKWIKTEVAIGYLLLMVLLLYSVWFVYHEMNRLTEPNTYEAEFDAKRKSINNTLARLYEAEVIGQSLSTGHLVDYPVYRKAMQRASASVDTLRLLASDSLQRLRMDSISLLLVRKQQNMLGLLRAMNDTTVDAAYRRNVQQIIARQDSVVQQERVQKKVVVRRNSYQVGKKKGFFKRLAEAFAPGKRDTTTITNTSREFITDTLIQAYNPADTVAGMLRSIQTELSDKRQKRVEMLRTRADRLRRDGQVLTAQINRTLRDFEEEEVDRSFARLEQIRVIRRDSIRMVGAVAIGSAVLAVVFLTLIWRDITRSNRYRRELEEAKRRAEDLLAIRERLMLTITHDLKAPVGSIIGYVDLLDRLITDDRQSTYLHNIKSSSQHLLKLVADLLDYHKLDAGKMDVNRVAFNPRQLFDGVKACFESIAAGKQLSFHYKISSELDTRAYIGDPFRIRQIVDNLMSNALKFTEKGGVILSVAYASSRLIITISDTGKGISEEERGKIFQEFTRLKNAQGEEGFGLGLSIVQKLVELLEGDITVNSTVGKGSSFTVTLPVFPVEAAPSTSFGRMESVQHALEGVKVILIDDDRLQLELTVSMLRQSGAQATVCTQPDELFRLLEKDSFDVLLTDLQMPALDGFTLLIRLQQSTLPALQRLPVVVVTARADLQAKDFLSKGFAAFLHKPFSMSELVRVLSPFVHDAENLCNRMSTYCPHSEKVHELLFPKAYNEETVSDESSQDETSLSEQMDDINFDSLTVFSAGDPEAAVEILKTFLEETRRNREQLQQLLESADAPHLTALAHKMLPLLRMIGAKSTLPHLKWLEEHRSASFSDEMKDHAITVVRAMEEVIRRAEEQIE